MHFKVLSSYPKGFGIFRNGTNVFALILLYLLDVFEAHIGYLGMLHSISLLQIKENC